MTSTDTTTGTLGTATRTAGLGDGPASAARPRAIARRLAALTAPAFVVLVLAGNSLTESAVTGAAGAAADEDPAAQALADLALRDASAVAQLGVVVELLAFVSLLGFAAYLWDVMVRHRAFGGAAALAVLSVLLMLGVKLGSGADYLAGLERHPHLGADVALALSASNGAAFVLAWLPFAVFVAAASFALRRAGLAGRVLTGTGLALGALGAAAALAGALSPATAMPIPFLLSLLWTAAAGVRLAVRAA